LWVSVRVSPGELSAVDRLPCPPASVGAGGARSVRRAGVGAINLPRARQRWRVFGRARSYVLRGSAVAALAGHEPVDRELAGADRLPAADELGGERLVDRPGPLLVRRLPIEPHARLWEARDLGR